MDGTQSPGGVGPTPLEEILDGLLDRLAREPLPLIESANAAFLEGLVALEQHLRELVASGGRGRQDDTLNEMISAAPLSHGEREMLHEFRRVRNVVVHTRDVYVGKAFARSALLRLRQIAARLAVSAVDAARVMTRDLRTVRPDQSLADVQTILLRRGISQVAVVDGGGQLLGWVTQRSLIHLLSRTGPGTDVGTLPARAALADRGVVTVEPAATIERMAALFDDPDVQALAVMDNHRLAGIVTRADLLRVAL